MSRLVPACLIASFLLACPSLQAQKDEKKEDKKEQKEEKKEQKKEETVLNKTRSEWLDILQKHEQIKFRKAALIALEVFGPRPKGVVEGIAGALESDKEPEIRRDAALTLGRMGEVKAGMASLSIALRNDKSDTVREAAAHALGNLPDLAEPYAKALAQALKDPHDGTRQAAAISLKSLGEKAKDTLPLLLEVAGDAKADRIPRLYCLQMSVRLCGDEKAEPAKILTGILTAEKDAHPSIRETAAEGLGFLLAADGLPILSKLLEDKTPQVRLAAAVSLGKFGSKASSAWPGIKTLFQDADARIRYQAIRLAGAVHKDHDKDTVAELMKACEKAGESLENRLAALQELGELGRNAAAAETLVATLSRNDARAAIREAAVETLKKIKGM